jgi:hypothetical protein
VTVDMRGSVGGGNHSDVVVRWGQLRGWEGAADHWRACEGAHLMESGVQSIRASGGQLVNGGTCVEQRAICSARSSDSAQICKLCCRLTSSLLSLLQRRHCLQGVPASPEHVVRLLQASGMALLLRGLRLNTGHRAFWTRPWSCRGLAGGGGPHSEG